MEELDGELLPSTGDTVSLNHNILSRAATDNLTATLQTLSTTPISRNSSIQVARVVSGSNERDARVRRYPFDVLRQRLCTDGFP